MNLLVLVIMGLTFGVIAQHLTKSQDGTTKGRNIPLITVIVSVNIMSAIDAISTIYLITHNYSSELNPFMDALIQHNYLLFFAIKMALTLAATLVCWHFYERKQKARKILKLTSRVYCGLLAWHCLLLSSVLF